MNKTEYLKSRISDLEKTINDKTTSEKLKRVLRLALINYKLDLSREEGHE